MLENTLNKSVSKFLDNPQARTWQNLPKLSPGAAGTVCALGCLEVGTDHAGIGGGIKATLEGQMTAGLSDNSPPSGTWVSTVSCSAVAGGVGGYFSASSYDSPGSGLNPRVSHEVGGLVGLGGGCSVMFNYYW